MLEPVHTCRIHTGPHRLNVLIQLPLDEYYAVLVGGANGDLDLLELIDSRSYKLQCSSVSRTRETENCMGEGLLTQY